MTDKLQDVVEKWIAENSYARGLDKVIWPGDLRAFLAQYVLCLKKEEAWVVDGVIYDNKGMVDRVCDQYGIVAIPLYAPASEVTK